MCGIFGYCGEKIPEEHVLVNALDTMVHRGPDQSGNYTDTAGDLVLWLGHRRLSILDLSEAGRQPFVTPDGKVAVSVNGEIYNVMELRPYLETKGAVFHSHSDSEVLLWGFYFEGEKFFQKIRGMFACAIWDHRNTVPRLILLRDRHGIKPMHYWYHENRIVFASELKAIKSLPEFHEEIDRHALDHYLIFGYIPSPLTIYENTYKVRPGEYVVFENGKIRKEIWWKIQCPKEKFKGSMEDAADELDRLVNEAVREQLAADVPLGAFLSGGIDSSLICAVAQKQLGTRKLKTFTIGFEVAQQDESSYAGNIAEYLGTDHTCRIMSQNDLFRILPKIPNLYDEPYSDSSALPTYLVSEIAREQVTTALSGDGGDEHFFGYSNINCIDYILKWDRRLPGWFRIPFMKILALLFRKTYIGRIAEPLWFDDIDEGYLHSCGCFNGPLFHSLTGHDFDMKTSCLRDAYQNLKDKVQPEYLVPFLEQAIYLPDDILCKVDRAAMACSLEVRPPLLDHRIVEFANNLPFEYKYTKEKGGKIILKKVLSRYIPEKFWNRPKKGFSVPLQNWMGNELKPEMMRLLKKSEVNSIFPVHGQKMIQNIFHDHLAGNNDYSSRLWAFFCLEKWRESAVTHS